MNPDTNKIRTKKIKKASSIVKKELNKVKKERGRNRSDQDIITGQILAYNKLLRKFNHEINQ